MEACGGASVAGRDHAWQAGEKHRRLFVGEAEAGAAVGGGSAWLGTKGQPKERERGVVGGAHSADVTP